MDMLESSGLNEAVEKVITQTDPCIINTLRYLDSVSICHQHAYSEYAHRHSGSSAISPLPAARAAAEIRSIPEVISAVDPAVKSA